MRKWPHGATGGLRQPHPELARRSARQLRGGRQAGQRRVVALLAGQQQRLASVGRDAVHLRWRGLCGLADPEPFPRQRRGRQFRGGRTAGPRRRSRAADAFLARQPDQPRRTVAARGAGHRGRRPGARTRLHHPELVRREPQPGGNRPHQRSRRQRSPAALLAGSAELRTLAAWLAGHPARRRRHRARLHHPEHPGRFADRGRRGPADRGADHGARRPAPAAAHLPGRRDGAVGHSARTDHRFRRCRGRRRGDHRERLPRRLRSGQFRGPRRPADARRPHRGAPLLARHQRFPDVAARRTRHGLGQRRRAPSQPRGSR